MIKTILFFSVLLLSFAYDDSIEVLIGKHYKDLDFKSLLVAVSKDEGFINQANSGCVETIMKYANDFETYSTELASMTLYSGRDLNDLGRFGSCNSLDFTRYIALSVTGLPVGIFFGICGPIECDEEDYLPLSQNLASTIKLVTDQIPAFAAYEIDWTEDNFRFKDSVTRNSENTSISPWFIFTC
jgi:hypothetical protein